MIDSAIIATINLLVFRLVQHGVHDLVYCLASGVTGTFNFLIYGSLRSRRDYTLLLKQRVSTASFSERLSDAIVVSA